MSDNSLLQIARKFPRRVRAVPPSEDEARHKHHEPDVSAVLLGTYFTCSESLGSTSNLRTKTCSDVTYPISIMDYWKLGTIIRTPVIFRFTKPSAVCVARRKDSS